MKPQIIAGVIKLAIGIKVKPKYPVKIEHNNSNPFFIVLLNYFFLVFTFWYASAPLEHRCSG